MMRLGIKMRGKERQQIAVCSSVSCLSFLVPAVPGESVLFPLSQVEQIRRGSGKVFRFGGRLLPQIGKRPPLGGDLLVNEETCLDDLGS